MSSMCGPREKACQVQLLPFLLCLPEVYLEQFSCSLMLPSHILQTSMLKNLSDTAGY